MSINQFVFPIYRDITTKSVKIYKDAMSYNNCKKMLH